MEPKFNTSFIPKKSLQEDVVGGKPGHYTHRAHSAYGPGYILTLIVFVLTIMASLGVFGYTRIKASSLEELRAKLTKEKDSFQPAIVRRLKELDSRMVVAKELVERHVALSPLFEVLEKSTLRDVQYTKLLYKGIPDTNGWKPDLTLDGRASGYAAVAQQTNAYNEVSFRDIILSSLAQDQEKNGASTIGASFSVRMQASETLVSFNLHVPTDVVPNTTGSALE